MYDKITRKLISQKVNIVRFVNISHISKKLNLGYISAILFCIPLKSNMLSTTEQSSKEHQIEDLADWLAAYLIQKGYRAHAQSQKNNIASGYIESAYINTIKPQGISILPQKTLTRMAGLGFIGKNNLLVTEWYGCAITICSVLTDLPVAAAPQKIISSQCGDCTICVEACPTNALHNREWAIDGGRESLVDVSKCLCCLKCMVECPWTQRYVNRN